MKKEIVIICDIELEHKRTQAFFLQIVRLQFETVRT
jgi:hypothetical protein